MPSITEYKEQRDKLLHEADAIAAAAVAENRDLTPDEMSQVERMAKEALNLRSRVSTLQSLADQTEEIRRPANEPRAGRPGTESMTTPAPTFDRRSIGQQFVESPEWTQFRQAVAPNGFSDKNKFGSSPSFQLRSLLRPTAGEMRTLVTGASDTQGGAFVFNDVQAGYYPQGLQRPLTVRDIITVGTTDSDTVEFIKMTGQTNNADAVPESTATADPGAMTTANGVKPESAIALAKVTTNVKTVAHWIPATKRALSDAGQLRTLIDNFLRYGLEEELEDQIVTGAGSGEDFTGIAETTDVQAQTWDTDLLTTTRKARTKVRTVGRAIPNAYLLNPADWEAIDLLQDNEARYYFGGPANLGQPRLWGLPVVESEAVTAGTGFVGDFRTCVLWEREQASIQVSDSHANFFIRNMVAILAEMRAAFGILQPNALVEIDLTA
jgi:HK97 family phage major capsid protein